jgi:dTDP-4-amino-4,6-dideoxygalactose transaminase
MSPAIEISSSNELSAICAADLAILGGPKAVPQDEPDLFHWPIVTAEDERAVVEVLREGSMSDLSVTRRFEGEWATYQGTRYALAHCNGTAALLSAMFGVGVGRGDEVICPSLTYWASGLQAMSLGATPVFADIDPRTLCIDPNDIERRITGHTKAIVVVHYCGHPADMGPIMAIANRHGVKVIEDVSHAHGALYKGRMCGALGHVSGMSMMAKKSFAIGEAGMLCTDDREIYERAVAFAHYERAKEEITFPSLRPVVAADGFPTGLPLGGIKGRINQTCSAMGLTQLATYPQRIAAIQDAMNRFWDLLEDCSGIRPHRPEKGSGSTMGGWYNPVGHYAPEELGGLPVERFVEAVNAEGGRSGRGVNFPMHLHPVLNEADVYHDGRPTRVAFADRDVRQGPGSLPVSEGLGRRAFGIPWFKHDRSESIAGYAAAFRKVALHAGELTRRA